MRTLLLLARVGLGGLALAAGYLLLRHVGCLFGMSVEPSADGRW